MDSFKRLRVDPRSYKIGALLFRRIWRLAKPYWVRPRAWISWIVFGALLFMSVLGTAAWAWSTEVAANLTNAIVARDVGPAWSLVWTFGFASIAGYVIAYVSNFVDSRLGLHWRRWLTRYMIERYLNKRTYYDIALMEDLDNPDQRIQEDITPFVSMVAFFPRTVASNVLMLLSGGVIIASITPALFWFVLLYAIVQTVATLLLYTPTIKQNFESTVAEADLRYGILHVRDNAETVAFYRGEYAESAQIDQRLSTAVSKQTIVINYQLLIQFVNMIFTYIWAVGPYLLLLPLFFDRTIEFGTIAQATMAATAMVQALTALSNYVPLVSAAAPKAVRLAEILERFDEMDHARDSAEQARLRISHGDDMSMSDVCLQTPGGEQALSKQLSLAIPTGQSLVIVGQTGVGKSSILRAMAGLWSRGSGEITMPEAEHCLFLPQRPYMILADLRSQLLYPHGDVHKVNDEELQDALVRVKLDGLLDRHGGLAATRDWGRVLSLGEQQRIAFARVLIAQPRFIFLDEATSAVDVEMEAHLYELLRQTGATYVSVSHRETTLRYHDWVLNLFPGGAWKLVPIHEVIDLKPREQGRAAPL